MTCQSFSSVSLDPPLVMFCPAKTSRAWPLMRSAGFFCVNFLVRRAGELSNGMATAGTDKFDGVGWKPASTGAPLLDGIARVRRLHDRRRPRGRRPLHRGRPGAGPGDRSTDEDPLLFFQGQYRTTDDG